MIIYFTILKFLLIFSLGFLCAMFTHHYLENLLELDIKKQTLILRNNLVVWETSQNKTVEITGEQLDKFLRDAPTSSVN